MPPCYIDKRKGGEGNGGMDRHDTARHKTVVWWHGVVTEPNFSEAVETSWVLPSAATVPELRATR